MKTKLHFLLLPFCFCVNILVYAQHQNTLKVLLDVNQKTARVIQEITFNNQTGDTLKNILLNDWNNAYSSKNSLLAKRFSDEFTRAFHFASNQERGNTSEVMITDKNNNPLVWNRFNDLVDLIEIKLKLPLLPNEKITFQLVYNVKIPNQKFTNFGYNDKGEFYLKDWFISPVRYENHAFVAYENATIDDIANGISNFNVNITIPKNEILVSDLDQISINQSENTNTYNLSGNNRSSFVLAIQPKSNYLSYKNEDVTVLTNLEEHLLDEIQKALIIDKITHFVKAKIGTYPHQKLIVSEEDYERNPMYGLNQLPSVLSPFPNDFIYEMKFLKTYLYSYLKYGLHLDPRKDNWIYDGIQLFYMIKYVEENYPQSKMMGSIARFKILKSFKLVNLEFNEQYSYFYMLMARKNLDQTIGDPKTSFIKFNEKIAGKYRSGLSFAYLDHYLDNEIVKKSISEFWNENNNQQAKGSDFEKKLTLNAPKKIDWFFETIVHSRKLIDYTFTKVSKTNDSITFTVKNKSNAVVPIPVYGLKDKTIVFKKWLEEIKTDSTFTFERKNANKIVINYLNEVPEYNRRNNWKTLKNGWYPNRPFKFVFMKDIEDPNYNQILYMPDASYNLYDGVTLGAQLHNVTYLDKPFNFDINPMYATLTKSLTGSFSFYFNEYLRESSLYNTRYGLTGLVSHYAPDASYYRYTPFASFSFRENDFRNNKRQTLSFRQVIVGREKSIYYATDETQNYSVFDVRYANSNTELTKQFRYSTNLQMASKFGKMSGTLEYRKLFNNNRQLNLRFFAGYFLYRNINSSFYSFALDRPTDYLFDYNYLGRSETTGLFSQQLIVAEGGFKTKTGASYANQWITTINASANIWNWIEVYGDTGLYKNKTVDPRLVFDSGIRLNLVTDYFELYFPVASSNGWDIASPNYNQKIRFIVTLSPNTLAGLFTRKWF